MCMFHVDAFRRFDALLKTYEQLAEMVLFTFRTDIRCQAIHYLNLSIRRVSNSVLILCTVVDEIILLLAG
jgi:hypothetical protein